MKVTIVKNQFGYLKKELLQHYSINFIKHVQVRTWVTKKIVNEYKVSRSEGKVIITKSRFLWDLSF